MSLCPYCDFVVIAGSAARGPTNRIGQFLDALMVELELRADVLDAAFGAPGWRIRRVSPRCTSGAGRRRCSSASRSKASSRACARASALDDDAEVTLESNPGPDERGDSGALRAAGMTRMSFGAQSFDDVELRKLGRRHRARHVADAVAGARAAGIGSINVDLLYDIPDTTLATWIETLDAALELEPDHLSLYALTLDDPDAEGLTGPSGDHLPTTKGARRWRDAARPGQDEDRAAAQYHHAVFALADGGFRGYEISNWAKPGHESRHNLAYWQRTPHEALGPGAHAFDGVTRRWTAARLDAYVGRLRGASPRLPHGGAEVLDEPTAAAEAVILGLRLDTGVPLSSAHEPPLAEAFGWALAAELLTVTADDRVVLTTRGRLLSNELFSRLI